MSAKMVSWTALEHARAALVLHPETARAGQSGPGHWRLEHAQPRSLAASLAGPTADQNLARGALKVPALALFRPNWFCSASEDQPATTRFARKQQFLTPAPRS